MRRNKQTGLSADEKVIYEAKTRFQRCDSWESEARRNYVFDMKFANGDPTNMYQWPEGIARDRGSDMRPCLTVNKTRQHNLQIVNDQRQHPTAIAIRPTGNNATYEAARVLEGVCRHIEVQSNAQNAYSNAAYCQVTGGIGYWRVVTDYASDESFEQEVFIRRIPDPLSVFLDPDIQEADGSDARFAFVFRDMPRDEFDESYGRKADDVRDNVAPLGTDGNNQTSVAEAQAEDTVRVMEYFRMVMQPDRLHELDNGMVVRESEVRNANKNAGLKQSLGMGDDDELDLVDQLQRSSTRSRPVETPVIEWYLIADQRVLDRSIWPGKYIPIVRVIGEETVIDGVLDRKGHTRCLIDPQRIYNYWTSSAVESVALQTKTPYLVAIEAIAGFEEDWENANVDNKAYLPYNSMREDGQNIDTPQRVPPPVMSSAYIDGMRIAAQEMMMVSGQYEANMGQKSNEVSGKAVDARERQGDNATYHFIDRMAEAIRFTGRILVDLIPKVYDTQRIVAILEPDGTQKMVQIDPTHPQSHTQLIPDADPYAEDYDPTAIVAIMNPAVGRYEVEADVGPEYATRRQETFNAITQILQYNESLMPVIGDLLFKAADFPLADEIAKRLHNMVPPQALGQDQPDPQLQQLQSLLAKQHEQMMKLQMQADEAKSRSLDLASKLIAAEQRTHLDAYKAETERMAAVGKIDPEAMMPVIRQLVSEAIGTPINPEIAKHRLHGAAIDATIAEAMPDEQGDNGNNTNGTTNE